MAQTLDRRQLCLPDTAVAAAVSDLRNASSSYHEPWPVVTLVSTTSSWSRGPASQAVAAHVDCRA